jgi:hypothetical protein
MKRYQIQTIEQDPRFMGRSYFVYDSLSNDPYNCQVLLTNEKIYAEAVCRFLNEEKFARRLIPAIIHPVPKPTFPKDTRGNGWVVPFWFKVAYWVTVAATWILIIVVIIFWLANKVSR